MGPRVSSISSKNIFFSFIKPFFYGLIKNLQIVIKFRYGVRFLHGDTRFHTRSDHFTHGTTFYISQAAGKPRKALFGLEVHKSGILMLKLDKLALWSKVEK